MAAFRLIPKEEKFYADFTALADRIVSGATLLEKMLATDPPAWEMAVEIKQVEEACDSLTHEIIQRLNSTFVTPIDREDIFALAKSLDDVMDAIDAAAAVVRRYRIRGAAATARASWPRSSGARPCRSRSPSRRSRRRTGCTTAPSRSTASRTPPTTVHDEALRRLFEQEKDAITIIKCKEMLDLLELATDALRGRRQRARERRRQARVAVDLSLVVIVVVVVALVFDYINGFHDAANSIATVVSTRVLSPGKAVMWAAFFNFVGGLRLRHGRGQDHRLGDDRHRDRHRLGHPGRARSARSSGT